MNNESTSPYYFLESPTSSESSYSSTHSVFQNHSMVAQAATSDYGLGYVWAPHYQQALNQRDLNDHDYCGPQYPAPPQATSNWDGGSQSYSYPQDASVQSQGCQLPLHAPVPLPGPSSILFTDVESTHYSQPSPHLANRPISSQTCQTRTPPDVHKEKSIYDSAAAPPQMQTFMNRFSVKSPAQATFPTPCELLSELGVGSNPSSASPSSMSDSSSVEVASPSGNTDIPSHKRDLKIPTLRPPEPEAITSHEKKRQYLECLEQYVLYLHEQLRLVGAQPTPIERFSSYRGLTSRSIRTLLVHMEQSTAKLNAKTQTEEQRFLALRDAYLRQEGGTLSDPYVAASVETGEYYSNLDNAHSHTRPNDSSDSAIAGPYHSSNAFDGPDASTELRMTHSANPSFEEVYSAGP
ncbi:hypothetical protein C8R41DRAFT_457461 [Lentinula lateritia]|uniref:BHLH domain-containing protein n=1 Tax=Lentinula lateritia TaxID=40482 RepID=A0ABQ8VD46_9AGAR|nr:hypothetical protein C8R41DRAFT_457461 [Lentinula lateritia]